MKYSYHIVTTPTADTPGTAVVLQIDDTRYLFGQVSEGTERAATERNIRLANLSNIFLTGRSEWSNYGGLLGSILMQADKRTNSETHSPPPSPGKDHGRPSVQPSALTIHGARNLTHTLATARRFIFRKGLPITVREYDTEGMAKRSPARSEDPFEEASWSDENLRVWALPISPSGPAQQSPKKRSLDEFQQDETPHDPVGQWTRDQLMRNGVVSDMFHSSWRADALVEKPLAEVKPPAKIFIRNPTTKDIELYTGPAPGGTEPIPDINVLVRRPWPGAEIKKLPPTTRSDEAVSYIVRGKDLRGKFDSKKAAANGIPNGPLRGRLARGENVVLQDGVTVTPDMVLGPTRLGKGVAVIHLPSQEYVDNLLSRPEWNSPSATTCLSAFIWILGPGVGDNPRLREFIAQRFPDCKHIVSSPDYCPNYLALTKVADSSIRLARLKGDSYSIPVHDNVTLPQRGLSGDAQSVGDHPFEPAEPGLLVDIEPDVKINRSQVAKRLNTAQTDHKIPQSVEQRMVAIRRRAVKPEFTEKLKAFRNSLPAGDTEVIALGTGSSAPSKYRNVSGTLFHVRGYGYYLLDCGEGTLGQLKRIFNPDELREVLLNLRMIWVSHLHADHQLGTTSVIKAWRQVNYGSETSSADYIEPDMSKILQEKRLFVVSDKMMIFWLEEYAAVEDFGFDKIIPLSIHPQNNLETSFRYRHCRADGSFPGHETEEAEPQTTTLSFTDDTRLTGLLRSVTGLSGLLATRVSHCRGAMAGSFVFPNGFKLSYSGDCRPSRSFAEIGRDSTVMIHEATFQDDMQGSAVAKRHSTTAEALEVGRRMRARSIILTHFSQRYQQVAFVDQRAGYSAKHPDLGPARRMETLDIPDEDDVDDAEDAPRLRDESAARDVIRVSKSSAPALYDLPTPVAAVFDYMRLRVNDIPLMQAFEPALQKLFAVMMRQAAFEAEVEAQIREEKKAGTSTKKAEKKAARAEERAVKREMRAERRKEARSRSQSPVASDAGVLAGPEPWDAPESESGWETSEPEEEGEKERGRGM